MKIVIEGANYQADALAQDLRRQIPEETGITVDVDGPKVVLGGLGDQTVAESLAASLNKSLPDGLNAHVDTK